MTAEQEFVGAEGGQELNIGQGWSAEKGGGCRNLVLAQCQRGLGCSSLCHLIFPLSQLHPGCLQRIQDIRLFR